MNHEHMIVKASGESVPFSEEKYRESLRRAGAQDDQIDEVMQKIKPLLPDIASTRQLHRITRRLLRATARKAVAGRYHLKQAIMQLGPAGYSFEKYVAQILAHDGYKTVVNQIIRGRCVEHEIDVVAHREKIRMILECKFHQQHGLTALQDALVLWARCYDIRESEHDQALQAGLVTNTRLSSTAIAYGACRGMMLIGWAYPRNKGLETMIDAGALHPITCLADLTQQAKRLLLEHGVVLCKDVPRNRDLLRMAGMREAAIERVVRESQAICSGCE